MKKFSRRIFCMSILFFLLFLLFRLLPTSVIFATSQGPILLGANYGHHSVNNCNVDNAGIIATYNQEGVREKVKQQLVTMHSNNIETLRLMTWHMTAITGHLWGVIPSAGGILIEPYKTNLANYLSDVKEIGFKRVTVSMGPQWTNSPLADNYDPNFLDENWNFLKDVRSVAKQYGPADIRIDLLNEGGPTVYHSSSDNLTTYITTMYKRYVQAYGKDDVTVSYVGPAASGGAGDRLQNLINIFDSTAYGQPNWYELHIYTNDSNQAFTDLTNAKTTMNANNSVRPIVIGETYYNNQKTAEGIASFINTDPSFQVSEIIEWPLNFGSSCDGFSENPPYTVSNFLSSLRSYVTISIPSVTTSPRASPLLGNINHDGKVDIFDYNVLIAEFGKTGAFVSDINGDGKVDIFDYNTVVTNFGKSN